MFQLKKVFCVIAQFSPKSNPTRQKAREKKGPAANSTTAPTPKRIINNKMQQPKNPDYAFSTKPALRAFAETQTRFTAPVAVRTRTR